MQSVVLYLHVHQPYRVKDYGFFDIGNDSLYFHTNDNTDRNNKKIVHKVSEKSYRPTILVLEELLAKHPEFTFALSFSGTVLEQFERYAPDVLEDFQRLVTSGRVEILADTYHHSLAFFYSRSEFEQQVEQHKNIIWRLFKQVPRVIRNTELSYRNDLGTWAQENGYIGVLAEGWEPVLGWRNAHHAYNPPKAPDVTLLLKNYKLSDDIAFRFGQQSWESWPLDASTFAHWVHQHHGTGPLINLFMDFETFGEHQWEDTGIFHFMRQLPTELLKHPDTTFKTPTQAIRSIPSSGDLDVPNILTWADTERDLSAWNGNSMQQFALQEIYSMEQDVKNTGEAQLIEDWRRLQTSDHFYYMCTKFWNDGDVHKYFSPYDSPHVAYSTFMNALHDVQLRTRSLQRN